MSKKNILIICAHPDDIEVGMGGTLLKYLEERYSITEVIFSKGEMSHPHLKPAVISKTRKKEANEIATSIGIKRLIYFNLPDTQLKEAIDETIKEKLKNIIIKVNPEKIFTVSEKDTHPDHRAVNKAVLEVANSLQKHYSIYTFQIWNIFTQNLPILQVDISKYFKEKIKIMKKHKSQWFSVYLQLLPVYLRAKLNGLKYNCKYAEIFYKIK